MYFNIILCERFKFTIRVYEAPMSPKSSYMKVIQYNNSHNFNSAIYKIKNEH